MTDQLTALKELAEKVESGDAPDYSKFRRGEHLWNCLGEVRERIEAWHAYNGSLDAAHSLHKAVLPEWRWRVYLNRFASVEGADSGPWIGGIDGNPARAWLLAIIKAKIQELEV